MRRLAIVIPLFGLVWVVLIGMFTAVVEPDHRNLAWHVWRICGILTLQGTAQEAVLFLIWIGLAWKRLSADDCVAATLGAADKRDLVAFSPRVAILIPAHREATTPEDAQNLVDRLVDSLLKSPPFAFVFVLFDSPESERAHEARVVEQVQARLRGLGRWADADRLIYDDIYRNKPARFRTKPGSLSIWLRRYGATFDYMLVFDADSSFADEDPARPETCDVLSRMVLAIERARRNGENVAMMQAAIGIRPTRAGESRTLWARYQVASSVLSLRYYSIVLLTWLCQGQVPSFGHNVLFHTPTFLQHVRNTHEYLSHDFIDAADLIAAGFRCLYTARAVIFEEPEAGVFQWVTRDLRWARGNSAWLIYLLKKPGLPLGPRFYLACGILSYALPVAGTLFLITSALLIANESTLIGDAHPGLARGLLAVVVTAQLLPRFVGFTSFREFLVGTWPALVMTPALMMQSAVFFLIGAFSRKWSLRGPRGAEVNCESAVKLVRLFTPCTLLGAGLWLRMDGSTDVWSSPLVAITVLLLIGSPVAGLLFSIPMALPAAAASRSDPMEAIWRDMSVRDIPPAVRRTGSNRRQKWVSLALPRTQETGS